VAAEAVNAKMMPFRHFACVIAPPRYIRIQAPGGYFPAAADIDSEFYGDGGCFRPNAVPAG